MGTELREREERMREARGRSDHVFDTAATSDLHQNGLDGSILVGLKRDWITRSKIFRQK
jgi:hypothetical protein